MITRGTTTNNYFKIPFTWANVQTFEVSYKQNGKVIITKYKSDCTYDSTTKCVAITLGQIDTLAFDEVGVPPDESRSLVYIQIRAKMTNGEAYASEPIKDRIRDVMSGGMI